MKKIVTMILITVLMVECFSTEAFAKDTSKTLKGSASAVKKDKDSKQKIYEFKISFSDKITKGTNNDYNGNGTQKVSLSAPGMAYMCQIIERKQNIVTRGKKVTMSIGFPSGVSLTKDTQTLDEVNIYTYDMNNLSYKYSVLGDTVSELKEKSSCTVRIYIPWAQNNYEFDNTYTRETGYISCGDAYFYT